MKELNLKEKIQNLISGQQKNGCPEGKFGYRDLTPESDTKNSEEFNVDKAYVEYAWKNLDNAGRHMLLVNHLQVYSIAEISRLLTDLGGEWSKLSDNKSRHKEEISIDVNGHNEKLLSQLQRKGFITSYPEKKDREKSFFEVWVKQQ